MTFKIYFTFLTIILCISLTGCTRQTANISSTGTEDESDSSEIFSKLPTETDFAEAASSPSILCFTDAWGEWHETEILSHAKKHPYNWDYLTNNETGISYIGDENYNCRLGVDVSKWQGTIDWEKVKADGYTFAMIRIGYRGYGENGNLEMDSHFYQNIKGAQAAGLDVGVYFFSQAINETEALEEAAFVIDALEGYTLQLPVVYDPELIRNQPARTNDVTGEQFTKNTIAFCQAVKHAGHSPMIYSNMVWQAFLFDMAQLQEYPFWYADYESVPQTPYDFVMWQYSETGQVDGIEGNADLNILFEAIEQ
uniref:glycoside hydrolase family 25 protein n=1 Tax=Agathobacter sp. TaxID=2021311 RepID=UPI0040569CCA